MTKSKITPIDNSLADIDAIANGRKYPDFKLDQDLMQEVQMSWAMFVEHKGGLEEAEEAVKRRLQKVDPNFATLIYGDEARPHEEENADDGDGLMLSRNRGLPKTITYDSPEGRRRMAAIMRAGAPPMDRGLDKAGDEASPGGLGQAISDMMGQVAAPAPAPKEAEAPKSQAPGTAKAKARSKSRPAKPAQQERKGSDLGSVGSLRSSGPPGSVASLRSSGPALTEPTTDDGSDAVGSEGQAAPVKETTEGTQRPGIWRSPSSLSSLSALSRKVSI